MSGSHRSGPNTSQWIWCAGTPRLISWVRIARMKGSGPHNGVGIPPEGRRSGLRNMAEPAQQLGGERELRSLPDGGTALVWWVPVPAE